MIKQQRGHIVTMSSAAAVAGICKMGDYCASKAAVSVLHEAISGEILAGGYHGINMTLVSPYLANTGMFAGAVSRSAEELYDFSRTLLRAYLLPVCLFDLMSRRPV